MEKKRIKIEFSLFKMNVQKHIETIQLTDNVDQ